MTIQPSTAAALLDELARLPADAQTERLRAAGPLDEVILGLVDAAVKVTSTEASRALAATSVVLDLADRLGTPAARVRARRARARALAYGGRYEEGLALCGEALDIAHRTEQPIEVGRTRLASMHALGELGRLDEAIAAGHAARATFLSVDEPALAARADINLGIIHQKHDQPAAALACLARARPHLLQEPQTLGVLDNSRGEALVAINDFASAESAFLSALDQFRREEASLMSAIVEGNLADLAARQGRLERALFFFESARSHLESGQSPSHLARLLAEQAEAKSVLGLPAEALREYEHSLVELDRCGLALEAARARCGMGTALLRLGRLTEAATALAAAATAFEELGNPTARARVDLVRAELALELGAVEDARRLALRAMASLHARPAAAAAARLVLGRVNAAAADLEAAAAELDAALVGARRLDLAPLLADILDARGRLHRRRGRLEDAVDDLTEAVQQIERIRGSFQADRFRTAFLGDRTGTHEALVGALLDRADADAIAKAFSAAEQAKSRTLLDVVRGAIGPAERVTEASDDDASGRLHRHHAVVHSSLNALYSRLADDRAGAESPFEVDAWRRAVREREDELSSLESRLAATRGGSSPYAPTRSLEELQDRLRPGQLVLEYFIADAKVVAFVIERGRAVVCRNLASTHDVRERLARLRFQIDRALRPGAMASRRSGRLVDDARDALSDLHDLLVAPIRKRLDGATRLTIVPHAELHLVPFHALWDGARHLMDGHEIHYVPSASLYLHLLESASAAAGPDRPLVVGVSDDLAPSITDEARLVGELLDCEDDRLLVDRAATAESVAERAADASVIHFACHGRYLHDNPHGCGLRMADGWMTVRDICALRLEADLVTLSGCETGLNRVHGGDELVGLLRSFMTAGARSVLASQWRVDDASTTSFMTRLYRSRSALHETQRNHAKLVRDAQVALRAERPHPAHWAPFILAGAP